MSSSHHGRMRASFDSETTSMGLASPSQSPPRRPVYFVQSPSRESHDGDYKPSFHSTPALSPSASPARSSSSFASRKILPQPAWDRDRDRSRKKGGFKPWSPGSAIVEEEDQLPSSSKRAGMSKCCICGLSFVFCLLLFILGAVIFWVVCRPRSPQVAVKDIIFNEFLVVDGSQAGVPTRVLTANCTMKLLVRNPSRYFGIHISESDVVMEYSALSVGKGKINKHFQSKGSNYMLHVGVAAAKVPLYGAGPNLQSLTQAGGGVPLQLKGSVHSHAYVFWKLVKPKFRSYFSCDVTVNSSGKDFLKLLYKTCTYNRLPT